MVCFIEGQTFKISTTFMNGKLIFTWNNISAMFNNIIITKDSQSSSWEEVYDDKYTVEDVMQYKSVEITVREYNTSDKGQGYVDYKKTYKISTVESNVGESKNISWTAEYFPKSGNYFVFHAYTGPPSKIIVINENILQITGKYAYHAKPYRSVNILFEVKNITVEDAGYYVGSVAEKGDWSERGVILIVAGKPMKPNITGILDVKVGDYAYLKCESRSTSAPYYYKKFPPLSYLWFVNDTRQDGEDRETNRFNVNKDVRYNRYSCQAKEILTSDISEQIRINPLYGPGNVIITPPDVGLSIHDGETFGPYNCSAECNPPCTLQWKYKHPSGGFLEASSIGSSLITLSKQTANRASMTMILCVVNGTEGSKISGIELNVQYLSDPKVEINSKPRNTLTVNENNPLLLSCFVKGNPIPNVTIRKLPGNEIIGTNQINYTLNRDAHCYDTSNYTCEGKSSEFGKKIQSFNINVYCDPRHDDNFLKSNYGSRSGHDVKVAVNLPVVANPLDPTRIAWSGPTTQFIPTNVSQRDNFIYKHWINSTIPISNQRSFGNYSLKYNEKLIINITIYPEDKPQPPSNFSSYSYAGGYVNLTWRSNFNGGPEQFFILSRKEGSSWTFVENITDPGEGNIVYSDLGPLAPGQEYWYQIESCNRINCSLNPAKVKVTVQALSVSPSLFSDTLIVIGASVVVFVLVVVLSVLITMCFRKKTSVPEKRNIDKRSSESTAEVNTQSDVVVYAAVDKSLLTKNKQQVDVVKSDVKDENVESETMYSEVIKHPKKHHQTNAKKEKKNMNGEKKDMSGKEEEAGASNVKEETRTVNQDGLVYIDVEFAKKPQSSDTKGRPVIHGEEERTEYTFVDFSQKVPPKQEPEENVK